MGTLQKNAAHQWGRELKRERAKGERDRKEAGKDSTTNGVGRIKVGGRVNRRAVIKAKVAAKEEEKEGREKDSRARVTLVENGGIRRSFVPRKESMKLGSHGKGVKGKKQFRTFHLHRRWNRLKGMEIRRIIRNWMK